MKFKIRDAQDIQDDVINLAADIYEKYNVLFWIEYIEQQQSLFIENIKNRNPKKNSNGYWAIREIIIFADENHIKINLIASESYGTPLYKLLDLYESFGFKKIRYIPGGDVLMVREPKNK